MFRPFATKKRGLKEFDTFHLVQASVPSRITYVKPLSRGKKDIKMLYVMVRKAIEQSTGFPMSVPTEGLLNTGLYNTVEELIEGHLSVQKLRMSRTAAERRILHQIGWAAQNATLFDILLDVWRQELKMLPLLRNMNPSRGSATRVAGRHGLKHTTPPLVGSMQLSTQTPPNI